MSLLQQFDEALDWSEEADGDESGGSSAPVVWERPPVAPAQGSVRLG